MGVNTHALYRFFNAKGVLLYVGITKNPEGRVRNHRGDKPWWDEVANITIEKFNTRPELATAELKAIQSENPKYNLANLQPRPRTSRRGAVAIWNDASRFGNVQDDTAAPFQRPKMALPFPCLDCGLRTVAQYLHEDGKRDVDSPVECGSCGGSWTYEQWRAANTLPGVR